MHSFKRFCFAIGIVLSITANSFAGNTDLKWAARWLLPAGQYGTDKLAEWTSGNGYIYGNDNVVVVKMRFDQTSIDTFKHIPLGGNYHAFGLEIEIVECSDSRQMETSSIDHTFSSETKPVMDTTFGDNVTNSDTCVSNGKYPYIVGSLLLRDPHELEKDVDYYVYFNLKNPIPANGVNLHLTLQLSYDVQYVVSPLREAILDYFGDAGILETCDYFVVESDSYVSFTVKPYGWSGVCWSNKSISNQCNVAENIGICPYTSSFNSKKEKWFAFFPFLVSEAFASDCISATRAGKNSVTIGDLGVPLNYGSPDPNDPEPTSSDSDPDLHINSFDLREAGGSWVKEISKALYWGQSLQVEGRMEVTNNSSQEAEDVDSDYRVENKRDFDKDDAKIDEDSPFDIDPGEREEKSMSPVTIAVSSDGQTVTLFCGSRSKSFPVVNGFIKIYFFVDVEEDDGDHDISSESDKDEYGKVKLIIRPPIIANFSANLFTGTVPLTVSFTDHSTNNPTSWSWNFGDGQYATGSNPSHTYLSTGIFTVSLTASNSLGTDSVTKVAYITVADVVVPPEPTITAPVLFRIVLVE